MQYMQITLAEMKQFLVGWLEVEGTTSTKEHVFEKVLNETPKIVVHVYSSIHKDTSVARRKGQDAIRICAVDITNRKGYIRTTRVLRVTGWKANLTRAIEYTVNEANRRIHASVAWDEAAKCESTYPSCPGWTRTSPYLLTYSIPMTTLKTTATSRRDSCPHCHRLFSKNHLVKPEFHLNDTANDSNFTFRCPHCDSILTVTK